MANKNVGRVLELFISTKESSKRVNKPILKVDEFGVLEDKFYNKQINRSVLITSIHSYELIKSYEIDMPLGSLGENIFIDYNPYNLPIGTQLKIGNTLLEISQNCTICTHLSAIDTRIPKLIKNYRGIFAKVIKGGEILKEDFVYILEE
ncbi:MOSC domain-containing protein [Sulfurimonas sp.]|jgi:MOSC domain-containing protein YiiM|uniref:MOSC domain-containing protein n=1 Tax=Sulfurimonas sp. TaxID=2022749 RepID=UPI0025ECC8AE|nr:MOSC domain-containing protein [Sulfurimonas sp.]MCK9472779.1 MOSC domain-containing protein [Sulfurimonas sp.]MDD3505639.1 MOSC domain-containing protein [Sulfurimonas sp.]